MNKMVYSHIAYVLVGYQTKREIISQLVINTMEIKKAGMGHKECRVDRESQRLKGVRKQDRKVSWEHGF